MLTVTGPTVPP